MGNSCKSHKADESSKKHFGKDNKKSSKNIIQEQEEEPNKLDNKVDTKKKDEIKITEVKTEHEDIKIEFKNDEKKEDKKKKEKDKKQIKVEPIKENPKLDVDNFLDQECTCNLRLEIALKRLQSDMEYSVELYEYNNAKKTNKKKIGETESKLVGNDKNIKYENGIVIPFHFSQIQPLEFIIKNNKNNNQIVVQKQLGEIVGSLNQTFRENVSGDMTFEVKAVLDDELDRQCSFNIQVTGNLTGMKIGYTITSLGNQYEPINKLLYESEILDNNSQVNFKEIDVPINELSTDDNLGDNIVEITFKDVKHTEELGKFSCSIVQLYEKENIVDLKGDKKAQIVCRKKNFHSLLDYLEGELHLASTLFIDFSEFDEANAHHSIDNETLFEKLMNNFIDVLVPYNEDPFFYIYAFGFDLKENGENYDPNMYPINKKKGADSIPKSEIKRVYDSFMNEIDFSKKKTDLSLIIQKFNDKIKADISDYDISEYNMLLLFTSNDAINEKDFVNNLIQSSTLPISVVIVGLGKGPFTNLEKIENDFLNLTDNEGKKAKRKCSTFISFNKNSKNFQRTVRNSLINIPNEMVEFLTINNIEPKQ
jgi:hypothetical protein